MSIELLDFWADVNGYGCGDMPSFALFDSEIGAASDNERRPDQSGGGRPLSKHDDARNDHPDELGVGEWRLTWARAHIDAPQSIFRVR
jgi:hypothetical protein